MAAVAAAFGVRQTKGQTVSHQKGIGYPPGWPANTRRSYTERLNFAVELVLRNDAKLAKLYGSVDGQYVIVEDIEAEADRIVPDRDRRIKGLDGFWAVRKTPDGNLHEFYLSAKAFRDPRPFFAQAQV